jgi:hypothetical protein
MQSLLEHPAFQSAAAPLVAAILVALVGKPLRLSGLAALAGFAACVHLATGLGIFPLSAARKIIALAFAGAVAGVLLDFLAPRADRARAVVTAAAALALVWVLWTALSNRDLVEALPLGLGLAAYCAVVTWGFDRLVDAPIRGAAAGVALGVAGGIAAIFGASALLGQMALATGAASGGLLLVQMLAGRAFPAGRAFTLTVALVGALATAGAVVLAKLPWYCLVPLALVPFAAALPFGERLRPWQQAFAHGLAATVPAAAAVVLARGLLGPLSL